MKTKKIISLALSLFLLLSALSALALTAVAEGTNLRGDGQTVRLENPLGDRPVITAPGADGGSVTGNTAGSTPARGDLNVYSAADSCVEVLTDSATGSVTIGVYYI